VEAPDIFVTKLFLEMLLLMTSLRFWDELFSTFCKFADVQQPVQFMCYRTFKCATALTVWWFFVSWEITPGSTFPVSKLVCINVITFSSRYALNNTRKLTAVYYTVVALHVNSNRHGRRARLLGSPWIKLHLMFDVCKNVHH